MKDVVLCDKQWISENLVELYFSSEEDGELFEQWWSDKGHKAFQRWAKKEKKEE